MQQNLEVNLASILAHSSVFFAKEYYSPNGVVDDARNGGDPAPMSASESTASQLLALQQQLPNLVTAAGTNIPWYEQQLQNAQNFIVPQQNQLNLDQLKQFGPEYNRITSEIAGQNQRSQVANDTAALREAQSGGLIDTQMGLDRTLNPEFYSTRAQTAKSLSDLLSSINVNGLSGSERSEIERAVNRNNIAGGNDGVGSALNTAQNASVFGSALQAKRDSLGSAIDRATSFLPASRTNIDPFKLATGKDSGQANVGGTKFGGSDPNIGSSTMNLTNGLLGQTGENTRTGMNIESQRRDSLDRVNETLSSLPSYS